MFIISSYFFKILRSKDCNWAQVVLEMKDNQKDDWILSSNWHHSPQLIAIGSKHAVKLLHTENYVNINCKGTLDIAPLRAK